MRPNKHPTTQDYLSKYRDKLKENGAMTAREWDHFNGLEKAYDPEAYEKRISDGKRDAAIRKAKELTTFDLLTLLEERDDLPTFVKESVSFAVTFGAWKLP